MSDLTASGGELSYFADRIWREVVVQDEVFAAVAFNVIVHLLVESGAQCGDCERLCFATGKECTSMWTRKHVDFARNWADVFGAASVDAESLLKNACAEELVLNVVEQFVVETLLNWISKLLCVVRGDLFLHLFYCKTACLFALLEASNLHERSCLCFDCVCILERHIEWSERKFFFSAELLQLFLEMTHIGDKALCLFESAEHDVFTSFVCTAFNHRETFCGSCDDDFKL